ncbi:uncharacterized protein cp110 isoform X2 [Mastacembelus armatus]|uniref:Uncharacterized LOC113128436 n=1 Tax=Mastacembelus armatus TaxID=205130 RepID=A0A3Q3S424_9TELE|nr:uncharacterized protein LOC113128436 isoform X2 [Mastacembelus armatus]
MEDYDGFVQHRLSHLRRGEEEEQHSKASPASSLIRFHGRPILPPLLSGEQREEMQRHREAAQKAAAHRKLKDDPRMAYVQAILHSVQLRKTPTLEELLQESDINAKSSYSSNTSTGAVSQSNFFVSTKDNLSLSPPPVRKGNDDASLPLLTPTTYSAFFTSNLTPPLSEECLIDQHDSQHGPQPSSLNGASHHSVSSGYVAYESVENTITVSGKTDLASKSHGFGSLEGVYNMASFFLHNTSNTIAKMPDIISYPPIDGEELERSGLESSFCNNVLTVKDICCTPFEKDSVTSDDLLAETSESSHLDSSKHKDNPPFTTVFDLDKDQNFDSRTEGSVSSLENSPEISQTLSTHHSPTTEVQIQHKHTETEVADSHVDEAEPSEEPYRLSLQALLKKSQEYRRRQRMLRNQAKNTKIQETTQEQPRARAEEQSLSDKENDESCSKGTVIAEGKKTKERRRTLILTMEASTKKSWENERTVESESFGKKTNAKSESMHLTQDENAKEMTSGDEDTTLKNNKLNSSEDVITEPKQINTLIQHPLSTSTETFPDQGAFYLNTYPTYLCKGLEKYHSIPVPNFSRSPVRCKSSIKDGRAVSGAETSVGKVVVNTCSNKDHKAEEKSHRNSHTAVFSAVNLIVEGDVTNVLAKSTQHIDQLESSLSSLKVLISDLESTVKENLQENCSQIKHTMQGESGFKDINHSEEIKDEQHMQLFQSDCKCDSKDAEYMEWSRRQSSDNCKNTLEDTEPEPSFSDANDVPLTVQGKGTETVNTSELRLVKTLTTERKTEKGSGKGEVIKSYACKKQQPPAKHILSLAQQMRVPDVFRNVPSEITVQCNASELLDTSSHTVERRNEMAVEGHDSSRSPSLNQSYDVDTPSDLWLLEGSGSDSGTKGHLFQGKHLTPESEGEGQGGVSKVKRRLLMHMVEEAQERSADVSGGVRPSSSTPRVAARWYEGHGHNKDKQEQLKQAHAAQVRALQDEHRRQQEELLQPSSPLSEHYRPLLLAAVKGFLTRRLLRTERVAQLVRTIRDTQQFLQAFQEQSPSRGELSSRQDLLLQERVTLQLRAARYEVYDIFFSLSARERMQLISWDRELARERELRQQSGHTGHPRRKSSLSAATQKSLERKRGLMIQKKATERHRGVEKRTGQNTGFSAEQPLEAKRGQFRANPQRIPKNTYSTRPR